MKYHFYILSLLVCIMGWSSVHARNFTDTQGRTIEAKFVSADQEEITIRRSDGRYFTIPLDMLSKKDRAYVREHSNKTNKSQQESKEMPNVETLNEQLGVPLFSEDALWDEPSKKVARRIRWPRESKTDSLSSYRLYPPDSYEILGSRPYSAALYGKDGKTTRLSVVFANKGDVESEDADIIEDAIEDDAETIEATLESILGKPERINMGKYDMKERVSRWDWRGHAILLSEQDEEYVGLRLLPVSVADNRGFGERITNAKIREKLREQVQSKQNGDVLISNIPMVDQGPKGYCVPATFERFMRYMRIPADMYILAMAGQTGIGGGTYGKNLINGVESYVSYAGRDVKEISMDTSVRDVSKYIDEGVPIMWGMYTSKSYNQVANKRTVERNQLSSETDWKRWKERSDNDNDLAEDVITRDLRAGHLCMIVGYNDETGEIAVSDSWGERYELRWITEEQAERVSQRNFYVIDI